MMGIIIVILFVLQAVNLFFLFSNKKIFIKEKVKGIVLKELPKDAKFKDAQSDYQIVYDILESIKLEDWKIKIEEDSNYRDRKWELHSNSNDGSIKIMCRIRMYQNSDDSTEVRLSNFIIRTDTDSLSFTKEDSISNDIIIFFWDYIIKEKESYREEVIKSYQSSIDNISSKLKTLKRSKRLESILQNESN